MENIIYLITWNGIYSMFSNNSFRLNKNNEYGFDYVWQTSLVSSQNNDHYKSTQHLATIFEKYLFDEMFCINREFFDEISSVGHVKSAFYDKNTSQLKDFDAQLIQFIEYCIQDIYNPNIYYSQRYVSNAKNNSNFSSGIKYHIINRLAFVIFQNLFVFNNNNDNNNSNNKSSNNSNIDSDDVKTQGNGIVGANSTANDDEDQNDTLHKVNTPGDANGISFCDFSDLRKLFEFLFDFCVYNTLYVKDKYLSPDDESFYIFQYHLLKDYCYTKSNLKNCNYFNGDLLYRATDKKMVCFVLSPILRRKKTKQCLFLFFASRQLILTFVTPNPHPKALQSGKPFGLCVLRMCCALCYFIQLIFVACLLFAIGWTGSLLC